MRHKQSEISLRDYGLEETSLWTEYQQVNSSNIGAVRFNGYEKVMEIVFLTGSKYKALDVELSTWNNFLNSPSKGQFYYYVLRKFHTIIGPL